MVRSWPRSTGLRRAVRSPSRQALCTALHDVGSGEFAPLPPAAYVRRSDADWTEPAGSLGNDVSDAHYGAEVIWTRGEQVFRDKRYSREHRIRFDGGLEIRVAGPGKGDAVRAILKEAGPGAAVAYLGDDQTDEDAFHALKGIGLTVLVRPQSRPTAADVWLQPPR